MTSTGSILVTGASSNTACRCIQQALWRNLHVKTTVRSPRRVQEAKEMLRNAGATQQQVDRIEFILYNELFSDEEYADAVRGCSLVVHIIPYSAWDTRHMPYEDSVSLAKDPIIQLLNATKAVSPSCKVVISNSFSAVNGNEPSLGHGGVYTEADWSTSDTSSQQSALSKHRSLAAIAERAVWEWSSAEGCELHITVINPVKIMGPVLHKTHDNGQKFITSFLKGALSEGPDYAIGVVDPRDLADLVFRCFDNASTAGERYIACADGDLARMSDHIRILKQVFPSEETKNVSYTVWPPWQIKMMGWTGYLTSNVLMECPKSYKVSNQKARDLGWRPRSSEECITAGMQSLRDLSVLPSQEMKEAVTRPKETIQGKA